MTPPIATRRLRTTATRLLALALLAPIGHPSAQPTSKPAPAATVVPGKPAPIDPHRRDDNALDRAIAAAHEGAARCLETGRPEAACHDALRKACEGLAVGRYCGMKHSH